MQSAPMTSWEGADGWGDDRAGLLSAARTAAIEGSRKGWTANVVAYDDDADMETVKEWAARLVNSTGVTGEVVRVGSGHVGKALP